MIVCLCAGLTEAQVRKAVTSHGGPKTWKTVVDASRDEPRCGSCIHRVKQIINEETGK